MQRPMGYDATKTIYLIKLLDVLQELGLPLQEVKAAAAVADRELDDREGSIALSNYVDAVQQAVQQFVVPDLGFLVGEHTTPLEHGVLGYALISSSNLRQCLERYVRFQYLQGPLLDITFDASGDMASLTASPLRGRLRPSPGVYRYLVQEWLVGWNQWCRIIGRSGSFFEHVRLGYSAEGKEKHYEEHLGCTVSFDNEATTALFAARHLDRPLEYADESIASLCAVQCERLLEVLNLRSGLVAELHRQLVASPGDVPTMDVMAARLGFGTRTLRRRLKLEGTTYKQVVMDFRIAMAQRYLAETELPANEIALLVGYSDAANVYRIFQSATGQTPQQYRDSRL